MGETVVSIENVEMIKETILNLITKTMWIGKVQDHIDQTCGFASKEEKTRAFNELIVEGKIDNLNGCGNPK